MPESLKLPNSSNEIEWPSDTPSIDIPIYFGTVYVTTTLEQFRQCQQYLGDDPYPNVVAGLCQMYQHGDGDVAYLIGVFDNKLSTLAHELAHTTFKIFKHVGIEIGGNNEAYCYLLDYLFEQCFPIIINGEGIECLESV